MLTVIIPREDTTALVIGDIYYGNGKKCEPGELADFISTKKMLDKLRYHTLHSLTICLLIDWKPTANFGYQRNLQIICSR